MQEQLRAQLELIETVRSEARAAQESLSAVDAERERLQNEQLAARSELDASVSERAELHEALQAAQMSLADKTREADANAAAWGSRLGALEEERDRLKAEIVQLRDTFEATFTRLRGQVEESLAAKDESENRVASLAGTEAELEALRSQVAELQKQIAALREAAATAPGAAEDRVRLAVTPARPAVPGNGDPEAGMIRVEAGRLDALFESIGGIESYRGRTHHELHTMAVLREQLNAWRTQFVERDRTGAEGEQPVDERTFHKAFAAQSAHIVKQLSRLIEALGQQDVELAAVSCELQQKVDALRLVPLDTVFRRLRRPVRDAARQEGKLAEFITEGGEIQVGRALIEPLHAALLHLVRNAVAHGIEPREIRSATGKPAPGTVQVVARVVREQSSGNAADGGEGASLGLELRVADDGAGIDLAAVLAKARERGLVVEGETPGDAQLVELIFAPGFSTVRTVNDLSGRGVGMDVVRQEIAALGGTAEVQSERGRGTTILLNVPVRSAVR
ncbi:MAG: ATP-binding protein [Polyangiaceae bacterium]|nr:ATP-binding protein [Polyangiaceae bacterium]